MRPLDKNTLRGLWSALPTSWTREGEIDIDCIINNCRKLAAAQVDGIYTSDSDGEFYAIEIDQFKKLADAFSRALAGLENVDAAMGVTWCNTQGIIDRIKIAAEVGIPNVHIAFPFFMPMAKADVDRFWDDLAGEDSDARWIHYAHPKCGPALTGLDYRCLSDRHPEQFIGSKLATDSISALTEIFTHSPDLAHFATDGIMAPAMMMGARGSYSYWVNTLPKWHRRYMDACLQGDWEIAWLNHKKLLDWERQCTAPLKASGHLHGILGKARAGLTEWLEDSGITKAPYYPVADELLADYHLAFNEYWKKEKAREKLDSERNSLNEKINDDS